ncbi:MAG: zinc-binding alcohol dehydrogenase family protein [Bacillaceae bacterium]
MKAVVVTKFGGPDVLEVIDTPIPQLNSKQVLIRTMKTSVNFADIKARYGKKGIGTFPFIPGIDAAGVIEQVGADVTSLKVGQRVICFPKGGSYAEYVVADEILTYPIPDTLSFEVAAACPIVSFLSYTLLKDIARIQKGETILIHAAAGGVGTTSIQLAKLLGAQEIIGTVGSEHKVEVAKEAGADHVIVYKNMDFATKVKELTNGEGVDIVFDSVSGKVAEQSLTCLAPYGRLVHFGNSSGEAGTFQTNQLHASCRSVLGFSLGTTRKLRPHVLQPVAKEVFRYLESGELKIKIGHEFSLRKAKEAHELMESRLSTGKILLNIEG